VYDSAEAKSPTLSPSDVPAGSTLISTRIDCELPWPSLAT
jgi:hypothetical protein